MRAVVDEVFLRIVVPVVFSEMLRKIEADSPMAVFSRASEQGYHVAKNEARACLDVIGIALKCRKKNCRLGIVGGIKDWPAVVHLHGTAVFRRIRLNKWRFVGRRDLHASSLAEEPFFV